MNPKIGNVMLVLIAIQLSSLGFQLFNHSQMAFELYSQAPSLFAWSEYLIQAVTIAAAWFVPVTMVEKTI